MPMPTFKVVEIESLFQNDMIDFISPVNINIRLGWIHDWAIVRPFPEAQCARSRVCVCVYVKVLDI